MALKRTRVPFYGKRETRVAALAERATRAGDIDYAIALNHSIRMTLLHKHHRAQAHRHPANH